MAGRKPRIAEMGSVSTAWFCKPEKCSLQWSYSAIAEIGGFDSFAETLFEIKVDVGNRVDSVVTMLTN